jgi:thiamine biosynthesis lipoprotein ApbE
MTMTRATASAEFFSRFRQLAEVVRQLALAIDDAPEDGSEPAVVEALRVSTADAVHDTAIPLPQHDLATCQERINQLTRNIRQELASYEVLREIDRIAAERAGAWPRWSSVVREVLDRCETAVSETANALVACWRELEIKAHT